MLGQTLVTKQTGAAGKPVNTLYIARKMKLKREMYFAILLDRKTAGPIMIGCRWGHSTAGPDFGPWARWAPGLEPWVEPVGVEFHRGQLCVLTACIDSAYPDHPLRHTPLLLLLLPLLTTCVTSRSEGGTSIEDLAEKYPDKIIKIPVDIRTGDKGVGGSNTWACNMSACK